MFGETVDRFVDTHRLYSSIARHINSANLVLKEKKYLDYTPASFFSIRRHQFWLGPKKRRLLWTSPFSRLSQFRCDAAERHYGSWFVEHFRFYFYFTAAVPRFVLNVDRFIAGRRYSALLDMEKRSWFCRKSTRWQGARQYGDLVHDYFSLKILLGRKTGVKRRSTDCRAQIWTRSPNVMSPLGPIPEVLQVGTNFFGIVARIF